MNERDTEQWRAALLAYELAGRARTGDQVAAEIRWVDSLLRLRRNCVSRGDALTVKFLERGICQRCQSVDQKSLDKAARHLDRYDAALRADQT